MLLKLMEFYMVMSMSLFPVLVLLVLQLMKDVREQDDIIAKGRHIKTKR